MISTFFTTTVISTVITAAIRLWTQSQQDRRDRDLAMLSASKLIIEDRESARKYIPDGPTKKIIALTIVGVYAAMKLIPLIAFMFDVQIPVTFTWYEWRSGFLFFTEGKDVLKNMTVTGIQFTELDGEILGMVIGNIFGGSIAKRR